MYTLKVYKIALGFYCAAQPGDYAEFCLQVKNAGQCGRKQIRSRIMLGALQIQDLVALECVCDWLREATGHDCGDRSWICNTLQVFLIYSLFRINAAQQTDNTHTTDRRER